MGAWYKSPEWAQAFEVLDKWCFAVRNFLGDEGHSQPSPELSGLTQQFVDACYDLTNIDPMPLWEVFLLIDTHRRFSRIPPYPKPESIRKIEFYADRCRMIVGRFEKIGIVKEKPGKNAVEVGAYDDYAEPDTRQGYASKFTITTRTLNRWIKDKKIRVIEVSGQRIKVHKEDFSKHRKQDKS